MPDKATMQSSLCRRCCPIPYRKGAEKWSLPHYATCAEVVLSAEAGCALCSVLHAALLEYTADDLGCTVTDAQAHQLGLDENTVYVHRGEEVPEAFDEEIDSNISSADLTDENNSDSELDREMQEDEHDRIELDEHDDSDGSFEDPPTQLFIRPIGSRLESGEAGLTGLSIFRSSCGWTPDDGIIGCVELGCPDQSRALTSWKLSGRVPAQSMDYELAKSWIRECITEHSECSKADNRQLPYRVLDLRQVSKNGSLRVLVRSQDQAHYATLSHCWGKSKPFSLMQANYGQLQSGFGFDSLPQTFQDAVVATQNLGVSFLWIDSLCIVQDSKIDWEVQCAAMASIYKNSLVTIAGPAAKDSEAGFAKTKMSPLRQVQYEIEGNSTAVEMTATLWPRKYWSELSIEPEVDSPLATRSWIIQEKLLCPRVLYFGSKNMYFDCYRHVRFDNCHDLLHPELWYTARGSVEKFSFAELSSDEERYRMWRQLITAYCTSELTHASDALPATSGLASELYRHAKGTYLAGIWKEDIIRALSWQLFGGKQRLKTTTSYIAPSWSWASAKERQPFCLSSTDVSFTDFEVLDAQTFSAGKDPFGQVVGGYLRVRARTQIVTVKRDKEQRHPVPIFWAYGHDSIHKRKYCIGGYFPDVPEDADAERFSITVLHLAEFQNAGDPSGLKLGRGIAVRPDPSSDDAHQRIGLVVSDRGPNLKSHHQRASNFRRLFETADHREYVII